MIKVINNSTVNISQMVTDRQTLPLPTSRKSHVGFQLLDSNLTLAYSKGQLGNWNGVLYDFTRRTAGPNNANFCRFYLVNICMLTRSVRLPIFIQIVNVLDLYFPGQIFEWNTFQVHDALEPSGL